MMRVPIVLTTGPYGSLRIAGLTVQTTSAPGRAGAPSLRFWGRGFRRLRRRDHLKELAEFPADTSGAGPCGCVEEVRVGRVLDLLAERLDRVDGRGLEEADGGGRVRTRRLRLQQVHERDDQRDTSGERDEIRGSHEGLSGEGWRHGGHGLRPLAVLADEQTDDDSGDDDGAADVPLGIG